MRNAVLNDKSCLCHLKGKYSHNLENLFETKGNIYSDYIIVWRSKVTSYNLTDFYRMLVQSGDDLISTKTGRVVCA